MKIRIPLPAIAVIVALQASPAMADRTHVDNRGDDPNATDASPVKRYGKDVQIGARLDRFTAKSDDYSINSRVISAGAALQPVKNIGTTAGLYQYASMGNPDRQTDTLAIQLGGTYMADPLQIGLELAHAFESEDYDYGASSSKAEYSKTAFRLGVAFTQKKFRAGLTYRPKVVTDYEEEISSDAGDSKDERVDIDAEVIRAFGALNLVKNMSLQLTVERTLSAEEERDTYSIRTFASTNVTVGGWYAVNKQHRLLASIGRNRTDNDDIDGYNLMTVGYDLNFGMGIASADLLYAKINSETTSTGFSLGYTHKL